MAFAAACRSRARGLYPADPAAVADRPGRGRRRAAAAGPRTPADGRDIVVLPRALSRPAGGADRPVPFGAVLPQLRVRTDRRALRRLRGGTCRYAVAPEPLTTGHTRTAPRRDRAQTSRRLEVCRGCGR